MYIFKEVGSENNRSSHQRCSMRKGVLRNFTKFTEFKFHKIQISQNSNFTKFNFFNKVAGLRPATLLKKRLRHMCFPVNFVKFNTFFTEHLWASASKINLSDSKSTNDWRRLNLHIVPFNHQWNRMRLIPT